MTTPEIAIVAPNTLTSLGLQNLLEEIIPMATIRVFRSFAELMDDTPDMYAHYFIASQIYFEHTAFFLPRKPKTIVLAGGDNQPQLSGVPTLNIYQDEKNLIKDILRLHRYGHQQGHVAANTPDNHDLSAREIEVLVLITKGLINKEIADKLNISLTTVITHRKNITEKLGIKSVSGLTIYAVMNGYLKEVPAQHARAFQKGLLQYVSRNYGSLLSEIEETGDMTDEQIQELRSAIENYQLTCKA